MLEILIHLARASSAAYADHCKVVDSTRGNLTPAALARRELHRRLAAAAEARYLTMLEVAGLEALPPEVAALV